MRKAAFALSILSAFIPFFAHARPGKTHHARTTAQAGRPQTEAAEDQPTLACTANGRNVTLTVAGNLAMLRAGLSLPEKGTRVCLVGGSRTAGSVKVAENLGLCQEDKRDPGQKLVFGPMPILGGSFDRFQFFLLAGGKAYMMHGTHHFKIVGACRHIEDIEGFSIVGSVSAASAKKPR